MLNSPVKCAVIGYGAAHNLGRAHGRWINATPWVEWVAVCDKDPQRLEIAKNEFPHLSDYASVTDLLEKADIDMVSVITPHYTHAPIAIECMKAGKHAIVDKAMCISVEEATSMIEESKKKLNDIIVEASVENGAIKVKANANKAIISIEIAEHLIQAGNKSQLEEMIAVATNRALEEAAVKGEIEMKKITKDMLPNFPGLV